MSPPKEVLELVEHFERNLEQYRSPQYKEAEVRREFIDPFFEALGWDIQNRRKYAEAYPGAKAHSGPRALRGAEAPLFHRSSNRP